LDQKNDLSLQNDVKVKVLVEKEKIEKKEELAQEKLIDEKVCSHFN